MKSSLLLLLGLCLDCNTAENAPSTKNNYFSINGIKYAITDAALLDVDTPENDLITQVQFAVK